MVKTSGTFCVGSFGFLAMVYLHWLLQRIDAILANFPSDKTALSPRQFLAGVRCLTKFCTSIIVYTHVRSPDSCS
jgi:hypothetical protein